jgi:hypothetical protein
MCVSYHTLLVTFIIGLVTVPVESLAFSQQTTRKLQNPLHVRAHHQSQDPTEDAYETSVSMNLSRRTMIISAMASLSTIAAFTGPANAKYLLNADGDYEEVTDEEDWQTVWKQRLDKAGNMSSDEIFAAARGAGNTDLREGEESDASKKRRAMSACRDSGLRAKAGVTDTKACNNRVMGGDIDFILAK